MDVSGRLSRRGMLAMGSLGATLAAGTLAGCATSSGSENAGLLRVAQAADATTLDPHLESGLPGENILINIFDTLTWRDTDNKLVPRLATSWEAVDDHRWRFHLRDGVRFHNGEPFDAESVRFSIDRLVDPATQSTIVELRAVEGVEVQDRLTADLVMKTPDPVIPEKVSLYGGIMLPAQHFQEVGAKAFATAPVGTGPFVFEQWRRDDHLTLRANPDHWNGRPKVEELRFLPMPNASSALATLQSDGVDLVSAMTPEAALQLKGYTGVEVQRFPGIRMFFVVMDTEAEHLSDVRIRRAINHAVDVPLLIDSVLNGSGREAPTIVPRESFGFDADIAPFERDRGAAKKLLAEAGVPDGFDITFTASNADKLVCEALQGMLAHVGIRLRLELLEPGTYATRLGSKDPKALGQMYLTGSTGWTLDGEATMQSYIRSDRQRSRIRSPEADRMIDVLETSLDTDERVETFRQMQQWLHDEAPFLFLYQGAQNFATNGRWSWKPNVNGTLAMETAR